MLDIMSVIQTCCHWTGPPGGTKPFIIAAIGCCSCCLFQPHPAAATAAALDTGAGCSSPTLATPPSGPTTNAAAEALPEELNLPLLQSPKV